MRVAGHFLVAALDLLSCVPSSMAVGLSGNVWRALRAARRFRIFQAVRVLKATEVLGLLVGEHRSLSVGLLVSFFSFSVWIGGAILVLAFELDSPSASIHSAADALWWSASTMTTVGYGDVAPVTPGGRVVAMILMLGGISVFGAMSGLITGFVFNKQEEKRSDNQGGTAPKAAEPLEPGLPSPRLQKVEEERRYLCLSLHLSLSAHVGVQPTPRSTLAGECPLEGERSPFGHPGSAAAAQGGGRAPGAHG